MNKLMIGLLLAGLLAGGLAPRAAAVGGADREQVDIEALEAAALAPFCEHMKRKNPHIKNWKKGELPTEAELATLCRQHPGLQKKLEQVREEFYREIETDAEKRKKYMKKSGVRAQRTRS